MNCRIATILTAFKIHLAHRKKKENTIKSNKDEKSKYAALPTHGRERVIQRSFVAL